VRGVAVSSDIVKSLIEREWIRVVGHRDVPGRPALYATTKQFLDYFNLKTLEDLPALSEIKDFSELDPALELALAADQATGPVAANDETTIAAEENLDDPTHVNQSQNSIGGISDLSGAEKIDE
jgi:segregation and condensation protein B